MPRISLKQHQLIKKLCKDDPRFKNISIGVWELYEQTRGGLETMVDIIKGFQMKQEAKLKAAWKYVTGTPMSSEVEKLVFNKPEILAQREVINILMENFKLIAKVQKNFEFLGLGEVGLIELIKKAGCWRRGGQKRAAEKQKEADERYRKYQKKFNELAKKDAELTPNQIHQMIGDEVGKSKEHVYKTLRGDYIRKKK